mmetsp:Transcript_11494/g.29196  ORF Transcript_11494/g.29196 Transcript_11494/m.29196 type:complete len:225 (-) Transcript_11494:42-716(-)
MHVALVDRKEHVTLDLQRLAALDQGHLAVPIHRLYRLLGAARCAVDHSVDAHESGRKCLGFRQVALHDGCSPFSEEVCRPFPRAHQAPDLEAIIQCSSHHLSSQRPCSTDHEHARGLHHGPSRHFAHGRFRLPPRVRGCGAVRLRAHDQTASPSRRTRLRNRCGPTARPPARMSQHPHPHPGVRMACASASSRLMPRGCGPGGASARIACKEEPRHVARPLNTL